MTYTEARRKEIADLFEASFDAWSKYNRNCNKLTFLAMTGAGRFSIEAYGDQLEAYKQAAEDTRAAFTTAAQGLSTEQLSSIISEVLKRRGL